MARSEEGRRWGYISPRQSGLTAGQSRVFGPGPNRQGIHKEKMPSRASVQGKPRDEAVTRTREEEQKV
ncbi:hypothetical protein HYQ46_011565 [Verticillium longisporum]|nr:hypothetical protein HYQ46_011565 [Verticillium longisporum]